MDLDVDAFLSDLGIDMNAAATPASIDVEVIDSSSKEGRTAGHVVPESPALDYAASIALAKRLCEAAREHVKSIRASVIEENKTLGWGGSSGLTEPSPTPIEDGAHFTPSSEADVISAQREHALRFGPASDVTILGPDALPPLTPRKKGIIRVRALVDSIYAPGRVRLASLCDILMSSLQDDIVGVLSMGGSEDGDAPGGYTLGAIVTRAIDFSLSAGAGAGAEARTLKNSAIALAEIALMGSSLRRAIQDVAADTSSCSSTARADAMNLVFENPSIRWVLFGAVALGEVLGSDESGASGMRRRREPLDAERAIKATRPLESCGDARRLSAVILRQLIARDPATGEFSKSAVAWRGAIFTAHAATMRPQSRGGWKSTKALPVAGTVESPEKNEAAAARRAERWLAQTVTNSGDAPVPPATRLFWTLAQRIAAVLTSQNLVASLEMAARIELPWAALHEARAPPRAGFALPSAFYKENENEILPGGPLLQAKPAAASAVDACDAETDVEETLGDLMKTTVKDVVYSFPDEDILAERLLDVTDAPALPFMLTDARVWEGAANSAAAGPSLLPPSVESLGRTLALVAGMNTLFFLARHWWAWSAFDEQRWRAIGPSPKDQNGGIAESVFLEKDYRLRRQIAIEAVRRLIDCDGVHRRAMAHADANGKYWPRLLLALHEDISSLHKAPSPADSPYAPHRRFFVYDGTNWRPATLRPVKPSDVMLKSFYSRERQLLDEFFASTYGAPEDTQVAGVENDAAEWAAALARGQVARSWGIGALPSVPDALAKAKRDALRVAPAGTYCCLEMADLNDLNAAIVEADTFDSPLFAQSRVHLEPALLNFVALGPGLRVGRQRRIREIMADLRRALDKAYSCNDEASQRRLTSLLEGNLNGEDYVSTAVLEQVVRENKDRWRVCRWDYNMARLHLAGYTLNTKLQNVFTETYALFSFRLFDDMVSPWFASMTAQSSRRRGPQAASSAATVVESLDGGVDDDITDGVSEAPVLLQRGAASGERSLAEAPAGALLGPGRHAPIQCVPGWPQPPGGASKLALLAGAERRRVIKAGDVLLLDRGVQRQVWVVEVDADGSVWALERLHAAIARRKLAFGDLVQAADMSDVKPFDLGADGAWAVEHGLSVSAAAFEATVTKAAEEWAASELRARALRWALSGAPTDEHGSAVGLSMPQRVRTTAGLVGEYHMLRTAAAAARGGAAASAAGASSSASFDTGLAPRHTARLKWHETVATPSPIDWYENGGAEVTRADGRDPAFTQLMARLKTAPAGLWCPDPNCEGLRRELVAKGLGAQLTVTLPPQKPFYGERDGEGLLSPQVASSASVIEIFASQASASSVVEIELSSSSPPPAARSHAATTTSSTASKRRREPDAVSADIG